MKHDPLDILLSDSVSPDQYDQLRNRMMEDEELRRRLSAWVRVIGLQRARWDELVPDRRLLLLAALRDLNRMDLLSEADLEYLDANADLLTAATEQLLSLDDVKRTIAADAQAFEMAWDEHFVASPSSRSRPVDRPPVARPRRSRTARWMWRVPLAVGIAGFAVLAVLLLQRESDFELVATQPGETRVVEFADGTMIHLFEDSRLRYVPSERQSLINRKAVLDGKALFDVAPQQQGLIVETSEAVVTVMGTLFGIIGEEGETEVTLVEGRLALSGMSQRDAAVILEPGQQSRVSVDGMPSRPVEVDLDAELRWTGLFVFRSLPLSKIAERLSEHYDVAIEVDPRIAGERLTGTFEHEQPVLTILRTLAAALNARVDESSSGLRIAPA